MTVDLDALAAWTRNQKRVRLAYQAQPLASFHGGPLPCLADCGRIAKGRAAYCTVCAPAMAVTR